MTTQAAGQQTVSTTLDEFNALAFVIAQAISKVQTATIVKVMACTNDGGVSPVGTVDVQPLVNMRAGDGTPVPHGQLFKLPYVRVQGGANAVIMDPQPGDLGIALFASRDISAVKKNKAQSNPGSFRVYDWADGMYIGGLLNGAPTQYVRFEAGGITLVSPTLVKIQAPDVDIECSGTATVNAPTVTIEGGGTSIDAKNFLMHTHSGVTAGGGVTGPVV